MTGGLVPPPLGSCSLPSGRDADVIYATEDKDYVYVEHRHHVEHPVFHLTSWSSCLLKVTLKIQSGVAHETQLQSGQLFQARREVTEWLQNHQ